MNQAHLRRGLRAALTLSVVLLTLPMADASAQVLWLQGRLANLGGPVPDGEYAISLRFYESGDAESPLYSTPPLDVAVSSGTFSYPLTLDAVALELFRSGAAAWMAVKVETEPELTRVPLGSTGAAFRADRSADLECTGCVSTSELAPEVLAPYVLSASLASVATSGSYGDLSGAPNLATVATSGKYADLTGKPALAPVATSGQYADLSGKPVLAEVAISGAYGSLVGKPDLASVATTGSYISLSDKPSIPSTLSCQTTGWGAWAPASGCAQNPEPSPPACPAGSVFTGIATFTQSDAGCGASANTRARVKSRCCSLQ